MTSVLITGTSKGIGLESALAFGRAGYKVHATMRNPAQSPELASNGGARKTADNRLDHGCGLRPVGEPCDCGDPKGPRPD